MKLATALSFITLSLTSADPIPRCFDQWNCIDFSARQVDAACGFAGSCVVEVCMTIDTSQTGCGKDGGTISHVCDAGDNNGCPKETDEGAIILDSGDGTCPAVTGQGHGSDSKCSDVSNLVMCQKGTPGEDIYFIIKDGMDETGDSWTSAGDGTKCGTPSISCQTAGITNCGGAQASKERLWTYTIPTDFCTSTCPTDPPAPTLNPVAPPSSAPNEPPGTTPAPTYPPPTPAPTYACVEADCIRDGPQYYEGCGSSYCDWKLDACVTQSNPGASCGLAVPAELSGNPCYNGPKCSEDGLQCNHEFVSPGTSCVVPGEDPNSFDSVCVESPVCTLVSGSAFGPSYVECIRPIKASEPCTLPGDTQAISAPSGRGPCHAGDFCTEGGKCEATADPSTTVCRPSENCCDQAEYCPGDVASGFDCPEDSVKSEGATCRESCPTCPADQVEVCDGESKLCPKDIVFADELCIFAGQTHLVGYLAIQIIKEPDGSYTLDLQVHLSAPLADVSENVKIYVGLEPPPSSPGSYNIKGEFLDSVNRKLSAFGYSPCGDTEADGFHFAAHFDMADGNTAWALPCERSSFMAEYASGFCTYNSAGRESCRGWGKYYNIAPCCPENEGCTDSCPSGLSPTPTPGTPTPPGAPTPSGTKTCDLSCGGQTVQTLTCSESATVSATCGSSSRFLRAISL